MIRGIGTDLVEVERIATGINRNSGFREMVFSAHEIAYCEAKSNKFEHYAARFAAKEAFFKALGTGWMDGTAFNEVEIINAANGKPELHFLGLTATVIEALGLNNIQVSLSHVKAMALAAVIIE